MKKIVITVCLTIGISMTLQPLESLAKEINTHKPSQTLLYHDMAISMLLPHIQKRVDRYYSNILTEKPMVAGYDVNVENIQRLNEFRSFAFSITVKVSPYVGPHISVGEDKMTFRITKEPRLMRFNHIKTEKLPPNWRHIVK